MSISPSILAGLASLLVAFFMWFWKSKASTPSLPPGPKPVPLLGNIRELTAKELWLPAQQWAKRHGDVVYLHILGQGLVFLNSPEAASDLLDKRGSIYSDKPSLVMAGELCGCKNMVAFTSYGDRSKRQRRLMHKALGLAAIPAYFPLLAAETHSFLQRLIVTPTDYIEHTRRYAGGLTLSVVYGYEAAPYQDKFLDLAEECVKILSKDIASGGGIWPVDLFPSLQYIPMWFPGAGFRCKAMKWKAKMEEFAEKPYEYVKSNITAGTFKPSFCSTLLEDDTKVTSEFEFDVKWTANSMYSASADSVITTILHFLLAMMAHPKVLTKAQEEIDRVVGSDRLPTFDDRPFLPYVDAILSETYRWASPVPLSLPHCLMEDDIYRGMHIPKGSLVFGNIWSILRDERIFANPDAFVPERYLEKVDSHTARRRDPRNYVFGFGRRRCPGANLVESSIWLLMTSMLATLDISKPIDESSGKPIEPTIEYDNPIFRTPNPFECGIRPRSEQALKLIKQL